MKKLSRSELTRIFSRARVYRINLSCPKFSGILGTDYFFIPHLIYIQGKILPVMRVDFGKLRVSALKCGFIKCNSGGNRVIIKDRCILRKVCVQLLV